MISKDEFIAQLDRATSAMQGLPVSSALLRQLSDGLKKGEPPWWKGVQKAWESRRFVAWTEAWGLFLTAVHYDVLGDAKSTLAAYFPSCGGTDEADPSTVFARYLEELPREFFDQLRTGQRRVFVPQRAPVWLLPAATYFQRRGLPYYVVEINAGAGLNLAADLLYPQKGFDSELIAARIGLDAAPLQLEDSGHRRWLTAALMPEEIGDIKELDRAMDAVSQRQGKEANFIQLAACPAEKAPGFIGKNIPADDPDVGIFVFNMGVTVRMSEGDYQKFRARMTQELKAWGDRALWLEVENVRGETYSTTYQALLHKPVDGAFQDMIMLLFDVGTRRVASDAAQLEKFLTPR